MSVFVSARGVLGCLIVAALALGPAVALAADDAAERREERRRKRANEVEVPVDVGVGPAFSMLGNPLSDGALLSGPVVEDQPFHYGLRLEIAAVIDREWVRENPRAVPRKYRGMFRPGTEVRIRPLILSLIPRTLHISPKFGETSVYGATWRLLGAGVSLWRSGESRIGVRAGLIGTYAHIASEAFDSPTHFFRPGLSAGLHFNTMFDDNVGMSLGWESNAYIPQTLGASPLLIPEGDTLWHFGEAFLMFHFRFPYRTEL